MNVAYPLFKKQDIDAFFALFQNNLANFVVITVTLLAMGFSTDLVFGRIIPGVAVAVIVGNLYYAHMAKRLAIKENRADVTALSYGVSTPVMFVFLFGVTAPALALTNDHELAWKIAVAAAFLSGLVEALVAFFGNWVRKHTPRPALLGALAGVAFTFVAGEMLFSVFEVPIIGLAALAIILVGFVAKVGMPFKIPSSLFAIIIGVILAFILGYQTSSDFTEALGNVGFYPFLPTLAAFEGMTYLFGALIGLLGILIPITIYNAIETMNNVDAMSAAGDSYDVRECQAVDGIGAMLGACFGGMFPTTVYIATVGAKQMEAGRGYSVLNAAVFGLAAVTGLIGAFSALIPMAAIAPILVFVGMSMIGSTFANNDKRYYPAIALAMLPYIANYMMTRFNNGAPDVVSGISEGIVPLGQGAMFTAIIIGAITVFIIDKDFYKAAIFSAIGSMLSFFGFMHAPSLAINAAFDYTIGYLVIAMFFVYTGFREQRKSKRLKPVQSHKAA
ncbi:AGZA family xanthine/uracil permease-like MFS transporter [Alkalihalobacillus xiaoxiensis]|uniref:AGZA family xanthine/uracil permease-like MFS transporter n=1 Tax=Shouchella xiaoxiensis TaxID=766895 RepID=A0ABS2SQX1_9BACI|nr:NCS2 family permease [Shouchella xiaoxiensis]MBM7837891.1 AGZA family xanthine/uracil permease-like MFS transporter [Shouchella xiaoxiensis]